MTPSAVAKLVERLRGDIDAARSTGIGQWADLFTTRLDELEAAIATAPPEQAIECCPDGAHVTIEARWEDNVWKVDVDKANRNSGFACKDTLSAALNTAVEIAVENYVFRRDKAGEKLEGAVSTHQPETVRTVGSSRTMSSGMAFDLGEKRTSAGALSALVTKWRNRKIGLSEAMKLTPANLLNECANELEAALASHDPQPASAGALDVEQVQKACVPLLETDALLTLIPWREITNRLNAALAAKASSRALSEPEMFADEISQRNGILARNAESRIMETAVRIREHDAKELASHDQKVRADALEEAFDLGQEIIDQGHADDISTVRAYQEAIRSLTGAVEKP